MKIVYIAHPISGDVVGNLKKVKTILRYINLYEDCIVPFAHYVIDCQVLDDTIIEERERGIENDVALLKAGFINEMWLYGNRISEGMKHEIKLAKSLGILVIPKTVETMEEYIKYNL
jgi:hypothetical protein